MKGVYGMETWKPKNPEEYLLYQYCSNLKGNLFLEVPVGNKEWGNWPPKTKIRRIDGVFVFNEEADGFKAYMRQDYTINEFYKQIQGRKVELIEVKKSLNRLVVGQVIEGMDMFERQYGTNKVIPVILCHIGDPALEWVCERRNIKVYII